MASRPLLNSNINVTQQLVTSNKIRIEGATRMVKDGASIRRAAEEYGIKKSTLHDHISGKVSQAKSGRRKHLNTTEEKELATFLTSCATVGYAHSKQEAIDIVQDVVRAKGIDVNVSSSWWKSFLSRHPELTLRSGEKVSRVRLGGASDEAINEYFDLLEKVLEEEELSERPCQIFNLDETGMPLDPLPPKVITKKGQQL